jgi:hypothetical protein
MQMILRDDRLQLGLFDPPAQRHSATSRAAAREIGATAGTLRARVLGHLIECGRLGATDEEMQTALDMNPSTQRPRRIELVAAGLVYDTTATRATRSGRRAAVWRARE